MHALCTTLPGQTLYWDINGTTAGAGGATPSGGWRTNNASYQNWNTLADGTGATGVWTANAVAVFSAGGDATGSFTVTVNSVSADSIIIEQGNILFNSSVITLTGSTPSIDVASGLTATFNTRISGSAGFVKAGAGTVIFQGTSKNYTGETQINDGTLRLGAANMIGNTSDINVAAGATFDLNGLADTVGSLRGAGTISLGAATLVTDGDGETTEFSGNITGSGGLSKTGSDTLILSGANTYTGTTSVTTGVLNIRHAQALGTTAAGTTVTTGEALQLEGNITVGAEALSLTGTGVSNTGALRNISGDNTYGGLITLAGNTRIASDAGTLNLSGGITGTNRNLTISGAGDTAISNITTGTGTLTKLEAGTLTLSGTNTYTGNTTISAGTLRLGASNTLSDSTAVTVASGATFDVAGRTETIATIAGAGDITLGSGALTTAGNSNTTFSGVMSGSGSFTKQGTGTLTLSGANTYTGDTTVNAGMLRLGNSNILADSTAVIVATGATFDVNDRTETVATIAGAGNIDLGSGTLTTAGTASTTFSGVMSGSSGSFIKDGAGTLTLSGTNTYTGDTTINAGTLRLGTSNALANTTDVIVASGATFDLNGQTDTIASLAGAGTVLLDTGSSLVTAGNASTTFSGALDGVGSFTKQGSGTLTLDSSFDFDGTFNLGGGTLRLTDTIISIGTFNLTGNSTIDFAGAVSQLLVTNLNLNGFTLNITNWTNAVDFFFATNWTGAVPDTSGAAPMNQVTFAGFNAGDTKWLGYEDNPGSGYHQVTPVPEPSTYGALLLGGLAAFFFWRRRSGA